MSLVAVISVAAFAEKPVAPIGPVAKTPLIAGTLHFNQGGKSAAWRLRRGDVLEQGKTSTAQLWFVPPGTTGEEGHLVLVLVQTKKGIKIPSLDVHHGPAGSAALHPKHTVCDVRMDKFGADGVHGSFTCRGEWLSGIGVSEGTVEATP
jgi:hypothetical protein